MENEAKIKKILEDGGKITDITIREKDKITITRKIEPVNDEPTSSTVIQTKELINMSVK